MRSHSHNANRERTGSGRLHRSPLLWLLVAFALLPALPGTALVRTPITLDGSFTDWTPVYDDAANCQYDDTGDAGNTNADITLAASTADATYLYHYFRRAAATGGAAPTFYVFIDLDGDRRMDSTDRVLRYRLTGGNTFAGASLYAYQPADAANGDPMGGAIAGTWPTEIAFGTPPYDAVGEDGGAQFEGRIAWSALGVSSLAPITLQFAATQGSTTDYTDVVAMVEYGVTVEPDRTGAASADSTVVYPHTISNTGNTFSRFTLTAESSRNWSALVRRADTGVTITYVDLAPGETVSVEAVLVVPGNAADGTRDTLTVRATHSTAGAQDSATDVTTVGQLLVVPDRTGSMHEGGVIAYTNSVHNNTDTQQTVSLTATSDSGWLTDIYDAANTTRISQLTLQPWESADVTVRVTVPAGTMNGTVDVTTLEARISASVRARAYDTTTVRPALEISPDLAFPAGAGTSVLYRHTVVNSTNSPQDVTLSAVTDLGWPTAVLAADGATPLGNVSLAPYGGSAEVVVRVTVPAGTPVPRTGVTTVRAQTGTAADTATDRTTVSRIATFGISGFGTPQDVFDLGDRVYARGMGLVPGNTMTFRWYNPAGTLVHTSTAKVDATGIAQSSYTVGPDLSGVGVWTVTLLNGTTTIDSTPFYIGYKASISSLGASGGDVPESLVSVSATLSNRGGASLAGTTLAYQMFWDSNADGVPGAGDFYIASDGAWTPVVTGDELTFVRAPVAVSAPNGTFTDSWGISNLDFELSGTYTLVAIWRDSVGREIDRRSAQFVAVKGLPELALTVSKTIVDFGNVDPGVTYSDGGVSVFIISSSDYTLQSAFGGAATALGLANTLPSDTSGAATEGLFYTDIFSITVPWATDPGAYAASVTYTVVPK